MPAHTITIDTSAPSSPTASGSSGPSSPVSLLKSERPCALSTPTPTSNEKRFFDDVASKRKSSSTGSSPVEPTAAVDSPSNTKLSKSQKRRNAKKAKKAQKAHDKAAAKEAAGKEKAAKKAAKKEAAARAKRVAKEMEEIKAVPVDDDDDDTIPEGSDISYTQLEDPHRVLVSSKMDGISPWDFLGMILDKRFADVVAVHKPLMGRRQQLAEGEYQPEKAPYHKEKGHLLTVHKNQTDSIVIRLMGTNVALSFIKVRECYNRDSDKVVGAFKLVVPRFRRLDIHGDMTFTNLDDGRISVDLDVYLNLNIPLIGGFIESFLKSQIRVAYKILPTLVGDFLKLPHETHPLEQ